MGDNVRRLTLIDAEKHNNLMLLLQDLTNRQKILDDSKRTPAEAELVDSHGEMVTSVKNKSSLGPANIVNYMRKKDKYLGELAKNAERQLPPPPPPPPASTSTYGSIAYHEEKLKEHFGYSSCAERELHKKYRDLEVAETPEPILQTPPPAYRTDESPRGRPTKAVQLRKRKFGEPHDYMVDGYLQSFS
ncbi:Hypothetical predicted protein [Paramuricea clavata]|uniref:Uncharacterized protein n=1 Tax=Paramuricea clavata TaxID=317549 RepID=A0A6S7GIM0_PARCT|nr:Hypothetical predicted protein [Paramuricea clavata]